MPFTRRFTKPGANMSNFNMPRPTGSVIGPPRKQGPEVNAAGSGSSSNSIMDGILNDPALKLSAVPKKSSFGFGKIGKSR